MSQFEFSEGQWRDSYNSGVDDSRPLERDDGPWEGETWAPVLLRDQAGWCGCVEAELLAPLFAAYLRGEWGLYGETILQFDQEDPLRLMVAATCDAISFTEHGGNVCGSWIRPEGERWLQLLERDGLE